MITRKFKARPVEVQAIQFLGNNVKDISGWSKGNFRASTVADDGDYATRYPGKLYDPLHESWINVAIGDWVVRVAGGSYLVYSDVAFLWKYEQITDPDFSLTGTLEYRDGEVTAEGFELSQGTLPKAEEEAKDE